MKRWERRAFAQRRATQLGSPSGDASDSEEVEEDTAAASQINRRLFGIGDLGGVRTTASMRVGQQACKATNDQLFPAVIGVGLGG